MRKIMMAGFFMIVFGGYGQTAAQKTGLPRFNIQLINGSHVSYRDLPADKPLLLIYFAPDCEHCREFMGRLMGRIKDFRQTQILLVSYLPLPALQKFSNDFKLAPYPNIKIGSEGNSFVIPSHFRIGKFPFTAVYSRAGKLVSIYREVPPLDILADMVKR